jgi:magnesium transporter
MQLTSHLEENPHAFLTVSVIAGLASGAVAFGGLRRLAKIRKVGLSTAAPAKMGQSRPPGLSPPMSMRDRRHGFVDRS